MRKSILVPLVIVCVLAGAMATFAGCGNGEAVEKVQSLTSSSPEIQALKSALSVMLQPSTYESMDTFEAAWAEVESAYDDVVTAADAAGQDIGDLEDAFAGLKDAVAGVTSDASLETKVNDIKSAVEDLQNAVKAISPTATTPG
jgi:ABC-type phosphate transport system substrate-binding protein